MWICCYPDFLCTSVISKLKNVLLIDFNNRTTLNIKQLNFQLIITRRKHQRTNYTIYIRNPTTSLRYLKMT